MSHFHEEPSRVQDARNTVVCVFCLFFFWRQSNATKTPIDDVRSRRLSCKTDSIFLFSFSFSFFFAPTTTTGGGRGGGAAEREDASGINPRAVGLGIEILIGPQQPPKTDGGGAGLRGADAACEEKKKKQKKRSTTNALPFGSLKSRYAAAKKPQNTHQKPVRSIQVNPTRSNPLNPGPTSCRDCNGNRVRKMSEMALGGKKKKRKTPNQQRTPP